MKLRKSHIQVKEEGRRAVGWMRRRQRSPALQRDG